MTIFPSTVESSVKSGYGSLWVDLVKSVNVLKHTAITPTPADPSEWWIVALVVVLWILYHKPGMPYF